jgi:hypothetical protein
MVGRAKSNRVKAHANSRKKKMAMRTAVYEYELEQAKPANMGKSKSI